jgi:hypothetical protein
MLWPGAKRGVMSDAAAQWSELRRRRLACGVELEASQMEDSLVHSCQIESREVSIAWLVGLDAVVYPWSTECEKVAFPTVHGQRKILDSEREAEQGKEV